MREIEAFSYWPDHASAISGFGGGRRSPDPRYCFHTLYYDARPGPTRYVLRLRGVRATMGELSLRVHAFRPPDDGQISLVSGGRLLLSDDISQDISVEVPFVALRGVLYAFYGYFSEDSDVQAEHVQVELVEFDGEEEPYIEPPRSAMVFDEGPSETRPANALIHVGAVYLDLPISQDCTIAQVQAMRSGAGALGFSLKKPEQSSEAMALWRETVSMAALPAYQVVMSGLDGAIVGDVSDNMRGQLEESDFIIRNVSHMPPAHGYREFADFVLWPHAGQVGASLTDRWTRIEGALERLKIGGLAVIGLVYHAQADLVGSTAAAQHDGLSRNEIGQWVLRLIGRGYAVAPLAYAPLQDLFLDDKGEASCVLVVRRI